MLKGFNEESFVKAIGAYLKSTSGVEEEKSVIQGFINDLDEDAPITELFDQLKDFYQFSDEGTYKILENYQNLEAAKQKQTNDASEQKPGSPGQDLE